MTSYSHQRKKNLYKPCFPNNPFMILLQEISIAHQFIFNLPQLSFRKLFSLINFKKDPKFSKDTTKIFHSTEIFSGKDRKFTPMNDLKISLELLLLGFLIFFQGIYTAITVFYFFIAGNTKFSTFST